jgi:hypothetical protein
LYIADSGPAAESRDLRILSLSEERVAIDLDI